MPTRAENLVRSLLEADPDEIDPKSFAHTTRDPSQQLALALRDELIERNWRHVRVEHYEDDKWRVLAEIIDPNHRAYWQNAGSRVNPTPEEAKTLRPWIVRTFNAACIRRGIKGMATVIDELRPAHHGLDFEADEGDFENQRGDWDVSIIFTWTAGPEFWSKISKVV